MKYGDIHQVNVDQVDEDVAVLDGYNNALREDTVVHYQEIDQLLGNAKEVEDNMYKLPKIV